MRDTLYGRLVVTDPDVPEGVIKMHPDTAALVLRMHRMRSVPVTVDNMALATVISVGSAYSQTCQVSPCVKCGRETPCPEFPNCK